MMQFQGQSLLAVKYNSKDILQVQKTPVLVIAAILSSSLNLVTNPHMKMSYFPAYQPLPTYFLDTSCSPQR